MNDSRSHELRAQLKIVDDMNDSQLWAQGFKCYEQLRVMDDMND